MHYVRGRDGVRTDMARVAHVPTGWSMLHEIGRVDDIETLISVLPPKDCRWLAWSQHYTVGTSLCPSLS